MVWGQYGGLRQQLLFALRRSWERRLFDCDAPFRQSETCACPAFISPKAGEAELEFRITGPVMSIRCRRQRANSVTTYLRLSAVSLRDV
jgi:hypothetical protein